MVKEIDRLLRELQRDPRHTRVAGRGRSPVVLLTAMQRRQELRRRVERVLVLLFNEKLPYERLTVICGRDYKFWRTQLTVTSAGVPRLSRDGIKLLVDGLRAHVMGVRDHLSDVEHELLGIVGALDEKDVLTR
jgi:hypothetical protein